MNTDSLISDIRRFLEEKETFLTSVLGELDLPGSEATLLDKSESNTLLDVTDEAICPVDAGHTVPKTRLADHAGMCVWRKNGYTAQEVRAAAPVASYDGSKTVVVVDMKQQYGGKRPFLPDLSPFDTAQRLAHYDHVISVARQARTCEGITHENISTLFTGGEKKEDRADLKSAAEVMREQRDYKRRRQTYRAKGVSTNRKSRTEIMREVIQNQMEFFQQHIGLETPRTTNTASPLRDSEKSRISSTVTSITSSPATENPERRHKEKKRKPKRDSRSRSKDRKRAKKSKKKKKRSRSTSEEGETR